MTGNDIYEMFEKVKSSGRVIPLEQRPFPPRVFRDGEWFGEFFCAAVNFAILRVYEPGCRAVISLSSGELREAENLTGNREMGSGGDMMKPSLILRQDAYMNKVAEAVDSDGAQAELYELWLKVLPEDFLKWYKEKYLGGKENA